MSHDLPYGGDGHSSDHVTEVEPAQRRLPAPVLDKYTKHTHGANDLRITTQGEATAANPASQSQTSHLKTHNGCRRRGRKR